LSLLNNPFVLCQCLHMARRLEAIAPEVDGRVGALIQLAYGRQAAPDEQSMLAAYARRHGLENLCRLIVNSNEFLFVN
jgi:hypothetical protein